MRLIKLLPLCSLVLHCTAALAAHELNAADVNAWLDGYMPSAMATGDIPGGVVVVVKDGRILTKRGFGFADVDKAVPADPDKTLFRLGSISKLLTWTAVMQLVEAGKLNLDKDVNAYLDFEIPLRDGRPATLRLIMTHSAGFEDSLNRLFTTRPEAMLSLREYVRRAIPQRIYPPGKVPAYSNYAAAVAGYVVERVSGEPFERYVQEHILAPLGMLHSTFLQPLPSALQANMASGYVSGEPTAHPLVFVNAGPAGALSSTGADMAVFMLAHLNDGSLGSVRLLQPETARRMHATAWTPIPGLPGMALGFYHEDRNGYAIIGHAGATVCFQADLHLFLDEGVGLFVAVNSFGRNGAAGRLRSQLFHRFTDRYFPSRAPPPATYPGAKTDAAKMVGMYINSRRSDSSFLRLAYLLSENSVRALPNGDIVFPTFKTPGGAVKRWREIRPFVWQEVDGEARLAALVRGGKVFAFATDDAPPVSEFQPVPAQMNAGWLRPLLYGALGVLALVVVAWPATALIRRHYGHRYLLTGRAAVLLRIARSTAVVDLIAAIGWMILISTVRTHLDWLDGRLDHWVRLLQAATLIGCLGAIVAVWNAVSSSRDCKRSWYLKLSSVALAVACLTLAWLSINLNLLTPSGEF
ncbi:MAG TPA: serine hydrolase domain-containing protein [Steroidobacteraceae bacterium]|nr:serine hydrolase domain-containing protein [Steroidobacteraceae bacterium]